MSQKPTYEELVQRIHHLEAQIKKNALDSDEGGSTASKIEDFKDPKGSNESPRDAKKMLQLVMDNIPQFIFWKDRNSVYLGCNQNFANVSGLKHPEEIRGKTDYDLPWKKEEADFFRKCDRRVMENDCPEYHIIEPQFQAGNRQAWLDTNKIPLHDQEGNVVGILGTYEDITERKNIQEALQRSEMRLKEAQKIANIGSWYWNLDPDRAEWSDQVYAIFRAPRKKPSYEYAKSFVHPEDLEKWETTIRQAINEKQSFSIDYRAIRLDRKMIWVHNETNPIFNHSGNLIGFSGTVQDITNRKKTEELLELERKRLFMLLETFPGYIYLLSPDCSIQYANRYFIDHFGDPQGRHCYDVLWGKKEPCKLCPKVKIFDTKIPEITEWPHPPDGRIYKIHDYPFIDSDGSELVLEIGVDISEMKKADEKIHKLNETLEQRVAERTAELESRTQQLQQLALELSDAEDRERKNIASILHDDFQQQLAYIKMELCLLGKTADPETGQRLMNIEGLLGDSITKSCDLSYEINPPALSRNGLLAALNVLATDFKNRRGFEVKIHSQAEAEPDSHTLAVILYRATRELLINSFKHAGVDSAEIDILCQNGMIYIRVKDLGHGFDYQAAKSSQGKGMGFGLYNIEDRITLLGGSIKFETSPGKGCCVELAVPKDVTRKTFGSSIMVGGSTDRKETTDGESVQTAQQLDTSLPIRVLLADDHHLMREALSKLLQGCENLSIIGQAVNGREAVQLADQLKPDVILMDVTMPELDGFEATAEIIRNNPTIRIIGLSMHNDTDTRNKMLEAGASAYLTKSGSPNALIDTINRVYAEIPMIW